MTVRNGVWCGAIVICLALAVGVLSADEKKKEKQRRKRRFNPVVRLQNLLGGGKVKQAVRKVHDCVDTAKDIKVCGVEIDFSEAKCSTEIDGSGVKVEVATGDKKTACAAQGCRVGSACDSPNCKATFAVKVGAKGIACAKEKACTVEECCADENRCADEDECPCEKKAAIAKLPGLAIGQAVGQWIAVDKKGKCKECPCSGGGECKCGENCGKEGVCKKDCPCQVKATPPQAKVADYQYQAIKAETSALNQTTVHLLKAAKHLELAGHAKQAQQIRKQAEKIGGVKKLIEKKRKQLAKIQAEIAELHHLTSPRQIMVQINVLEADLKKIRQLGIDVEHWSHVAKTIEQKSKGKGGAKQTVKLVLPCPQPGVGSVVANPNSKVFAFLKSLEKNNGLKVVSRPQIMTLNGQPACVSIEEHVPVATAANHVHKFIPQGIHVEVIPVVIGDDKVRLQVKPRITKVFKNSKKSKKGQQKGNKSKPDTEIQAGVVLDACAHAELKTGQTLILWSGPEKSKSDGSVGVVILATPHVIKTAPSSFGSPHQAAGTKKPVKR